MGQKTYADQKIKNPEYINIPLHKTPAGSLIAALDVAGRLVKAWRVPEEHRSIRINVSTFEKGAYRFVRPVRTDNGYKLEEFIFVKLHNPIAVIGARVNPIRGKKAVYLTPEILLPERLFKKSNSTSNILLQEIAPPQDELTPPLIIAISSFFTRNARAAVACIAMLFAMFIVAPVTLADGKGGDNREGGVAGLGRQDVMWRK